MKIQVISDTHGKPFLDYVNDCDILLHCGDISPDPAWNGNWAQWKASVIDFQKKWFDSFFDEMERVDAKHFVFIGGNHDFYLESLMLEDKEAEFKERAKNVRNIHYLRDDFIELEGIKIYGTPWVTNLKRWAFNRTEFMLENTYSKIPQGLDILMTHAPAKGYCDTIMEYGLTEHLGSRSLIAVINDKCPKNVFNGHIHSGDHEPVKHLIRDITFANVSLLDEKYEFKYKPYEFDIIK